MSMWGRIFGFAEPLRMAFERLNQRDQFIVAGGGTAAFLLVMLGFGWSVSSAIDRVERRVKVKGEQLAQVLELQGAYRQRQREQEERIASLQRSNVRLVSVAESAARKAGVNIGQLRPEDGESNDDGVIESVVDLRATDLTADRLQEFLNVLVKSPGLIIVKRLKVSRPYRKKTADIELTIMTYKLKSS